MKSLEHLARIRDIHVCFRFRIGRMPGIQSQQIWAMVGMGRREIGGGEAKKSQGDKTQAPRSEKQKPSPRLLLGHSLAYRAEKPNNMCASLFRQPNEAGSREIWLANIPCQPSPIPNRPLRQQHSSLLAYNTTPVSCVNVDVIQSRAA